MSDKIIKTNAQWKNTLTPEQYHVLREKGTELPFTGKYEHFKEKGIFKCAACGNELFSSETKYDSGSGWPSFWQPITDASVETEEDYSLYLKRVEIKCSKCGGHLGHVFKDGPEPTGLRYCVNSLSLQFLAK